MSYNDSFLIGYIAGEGHFGMHLSEEGPHGVRIYPQFQLNSQDHELLEKAQDRIGGNTYEISYGDYEKQTMWKIASKKEINDLIDYIDIHAPTDFFLSDKGQIFNKWTELVRKSKTVEDANDVRELIRESKSLNKGSHGGGRDVEDWLDCVKE